MYLDKNKKCMNINFNQSTVELIVGNDIYVSYSNYYKYVEFLAESFGNVKEIFVTA